MSQVCVVIVSLAIGSCMLPESRTSEFTRGDFLSLVSVSAKPDSEHTAAAFDRNGTMWYYSLNNAFSLRRADCSRTFAEEGHRGYEVILLVAEPYHAEVRSWFRQHVGRQCAWLIDGTLHDVQRLPVQIGGTVLVLSGFSTMGQAEAMAERIRTTDPGPPPLPRPPDPMPEELRLEDGSVVEPEDIQ